MANHHSLFVKIYGPEGSASHKGKGKGFKRMINFHLGFHWRSYIIHNGCPLCFCSQLFESKNKGVRNIKLFQTNNHNLDRIGKIEFTVTTMEMNLEPVCHPRSLKKPKTANHASLFSFGPMSKQALGDDGVNFIKKHFIDNKELVVKDWSKSHTYIKDDGEIFKLNSYVHVLGLNAKGAEVTWVAKIMGIHKNKLDGTAIILVLYYDRATGETHTYKSLKEYQIITFGAIKSVKLLDVNIDATTCLLFPTTKLK
ncbi:hypothetical protein SAMD00019534_125470 [Acytostelium subglobosum LB1]|uniref:hypothetical protein n=1 Tax=Acytostelium subglobosum LB1 TaxID=1410327 RepID=UPI000644E244|nr:hypothetical protein SAMD00019534_125470 [Acytostelium subglobosum LB1]GAM29371.1 hypothetical protein SAMD00019534_125470 [Acytostelium subglobosum LB1]|eukprot:XP_012747676.1 hypothetical protein SAMD00019534_125470 [Acytostelium subglobosum LB1]